MTGDPDAPDTVGEYWSPRLQKNVPEMNDNKAPQELKFRLGRFNGLKMPGTWRYRVGPNEWAYNERPVQVTEPGKLIKIAPYSRIKVTEEQKESILATQRDAPKALSSRVILSRPPREDGFEPDYADREFWTLDNMRAYLELIPGSGGRPMGRDLIGPSEAEIRAKFADEDEADIAIEAARYDMWTRCFLRCADPKFKLPSKKEFDAAVARKAKAAKAAEKKQAQQAQP
jgi:hypothetical protein